MSSPSLLHPLAVINAFAVDIMRNTGLTTTQASLANAGLSLLTLVSWSGGVRPW